MLPEKFAGKTKTPAGGGGGGGGGSSAGAGDADEAVEAVGAKLETDAQSDSSSPGRCAKSDSQSESSSTGRCVKVRHKRFQRFDRTVFGTAPATLAPHIGQSQLFLRMRNLGFGPMHRGLNFANPFLFMRRYTDMALTP